MCLFAGCDYNDCSFDIAGDQLRLADSIEQNNKTYYLYTRTTGWQEKVIYFELYDKEPSFDQCTYRSNIDHLYMVAYDDYPEVKYVKEIILQPNLPEKLKIIYTKDKNEGIANIYDVKFTR